MTPNSSRITSLLTLAAMLATAFAPTLAYAQSCKLLALQKTPCELVPVDVVARTLGVAAASVQVEDNVKIMGNMPELTTCIYSLADGGGVRVGQFAASSSAAFDRRYRSQSDAEIAAGIGQGTRQAEKAIGRSITGTEKTSAQAQAAEMVRGLQFQPVSGLGDKASVMYSGRSPNAHLITLVGDQTFVVQVRTAKGPREKNLELAKPIAAAVATRCR